MSEYSNCDVCKMIIDGSLKVHQIGNNYYICQSCRKIYYTIWHEIFDKLLLKVFEHFEKKNISRSETPNGMNSVTNSTSRTQPYSTLVANLDVSIISDMVCDILKSATFTNYCLNNIEFHVSDSYKTCKIKASDYAIKARNDTLKRKLQIRRVDFKLNKKCDLCRFKFILFEIKEIPKIKLKFSQLQNYEFKLIMFLRNLEAAYCKSKSNNFANHESISIYSRCLALLYSKKEEFVSQVLKRLEGETQHEGVKKVQLRMEKLQLDSDLGTKSDTPGTKCIPLSGHYATDIPIAKKLKCEVEDTNNLKIHSPGAMSTQTEYISTSDMELYQEDSASAVIIKQTLDGYSNFNHPGGYNSPYDIKMTIKNIFSIFNNFKKILREGLKMEYCWNLKQSFEPQELIPLKSFDERGAFLKLVS